MATDERSTQPLAVQGGMQGGVATWRTDGVVTAGALAASLARCDSHMAAHLAQSLIADYRGARMLVDPASVLRAAESVVSGGAKSIAMPAALLVPQDMAEFWRSYAWPMARQGIVRSVFTCADAAGRWATVQAAVERADRARPQSPASAG